MSTIRNVWRCKMVWLKIYVNKHKAGTIYHRGVGGQSHETADSGYCPIWCLTKTTRLRWESVAINFSIVTIAVESYCKEAAWKSLHTAGLRDGMMLNEY
jgi:hypothetical protein